MFNIQTERLILKAHRMEELEKLHRWENDPEIEFMVDERPPDRLETIEESRKYLHEVMSISPETDDLIDYGIYLQQDDTLVGWGQIAEIDRYNKKCAVSICIGEKKQRGNGFAGETLKAIIKFCFEILGMNRIGCEIFSNNLISVHVFESLGFKREGIFRQWVLKKGRYEDLYLYGLLREEFENENR